MMRSYSYAAFAALFEASQDRSSEFDRLLPWALSWDAWTSASFLRSYLEVTEGASFIPAERSQLAELLRCYMLDKALYELQYELNNRPTWVRIPLSAVAMLADRPATGNVPPSTRPEE